MGISREHLQAKRDELTKTLVAYQNQIFALQGALQLLDELELEVSEEMSLGDLGKQLGLTLDQPVPVDTVEAIVAE
jgi:hypothetical protein